MGLKGDRFRQKIARKMAENAWQPFEAVDLEKQENPPKGISAAYRNNLYSVQVYPHTTTFGPVELLAIRAHVQTNSHRMTWATKQRIKNEIMGPERTAVEVYPPVSELVDSADMYWLWVIPEGTHLPFKLNLIHANTGKGIQI